MALTQEQLRRVRRSDVGAGHNKLKAARLAAGLTQVEMAALIGLPQNKVSDYERGVFLNPSLETVHKFASFFGCAIEDLFPSRQEVA